MGILVGGVMQTNNPNGSFQLHHDSPTALYQQLAQHLQAQIENGTLAPGERIDSEAGLGSRFGVSRITIRQATEELVKLGLLVRKQGKGTFVTEPKVRQDLRTQGFFDALMVHGQNPEARLVFFDADTPPDNVMELFGLEKGQKAMRLSRLYLINGHAIAFGSSWLPEKLCSLPIGDVQSLSSVALIEKALGTQVTRSEITIRGSLAGRSLAARLDISPRSPVLSVIRQSHDALGQCVEVSQTTVNSESYEFTLAGEGRIAIAEAAK